MLDSIKMHLTEFDQRTQLKSLLKVMKRLRENLSFEIPTKKSADIFPGC